MPTSSKLIALAVVIAVAAVGWVLLRDPAVEPAGPSADPTPPRADAPADRTEPPADAPASPPAADAPVEPPAVEPPAAPRAPEAPEAEHLYPEQLRLERATWSDVPAKDVLLEIGRRARLEMVMSDAIARKLETSQVTLDLENTTGAIVISRVLVPLQLSYTVRDGRVHIFEDDD